jgi:hypothetical protein
MQAEQIGFGHFPALPSFIHCHVAVQPRNSALPVGARLTFA